MRAPPEVRAHRRVDARGASRLRVRRGVQLGFALLFLGAPFANAAGVTWLFATGSSTRLGRLELLDPAAALSVLIATRSIAAGVVLAAAPLALLFAVLGSVFCGWACPWGLVSELLDRLRAPAARRRWAEGADRRARAVRLLALGVVFAGGALSAVPLAALLAGPRIGTAIALELSALETLSSTTALLLFALLGIELFAPRRLWCRALCPVGGLSALLRSPLTASVGTVGECTCTGVPACQTVCPWALDPRTARWASGCTTCMVCVDACPAHSLRLLGPGGAERR